MVLIEEMVTPTYPDSVRQAIVGHLYHIGADNQVPDDVQAQESFLQDFIHEFIEDNKVFPTDLPIDFVVREFGKAVLNGAANLQGFNVRAHLEAFRAWWPAAESAIRRKLEPPRPMLGPAQPPTPEQELAKVRDQIQAVHSYRTITGDPKALSLYLSKCEDRQRQLQARLQ